MIVNLGLTQNYDHWEEDIELEISFHDNIKMPSIILNFNFSLNGISFGSVFRVQAMISSGEGGD